MKRRWSSAGESPARELGSLHPEAIGAAGGGNEAVGASGVEGRIGDLASMQAVTWSEPGAGLDRAGKSLEEGESGDEPSSIRPAGAVATASMQS